MPRPTPPSNVPDLSEEEAAQTPNGYPNLYDQVEASEAVLRKGVEAEGKKLASEHAKAESKEDEPKTAPKAEASK